MKAVEIKQGLWEIVIDRRVMRFQLTELGLVSEQVSVVAGRNVSHAPELLSYHDALAKSEEQMRLF